MSMRTQQRPPSERVSDAALKAASLGRAAMERAALTAHHRHSNRDGVTLVAVLVCLGLITALLLGAFQSSLKQRRQLDRELQMEQTRWLARAAVAHGREFARSKDVSETTPITFKPKLSGDLPSNIQIEFEQTEFKGYYQTTVNAKAWIGNEERPEQNTRFNLQSLLISKPPSRE